MSATGLEVFDTTVHKTNSWLHDLMQLLDWQDKHQAYLARRATLHALRGRLTVEEVAHLGTQLPMLIRGFYYEGWDPTGEPLRTRHREQFFLRIRQQFKGDVSPAQQVEQGEIKFVLVGKKLRGGFVLIRTGTPKRWLQIERREEPADPSWDIERPELDRSLKSGRTLLEIGRSRS